MSRFNAPQWIYDLLFIAFVVGLMMTAIILSSSK